MSLSMRVSSVSWCRLVVILVVVVVVVVVVVGVVGVVVVVVVVVVVAAAAAAVVVVVVEVVVIVIIIVVVVIVECKGSALNCLEFYLSRFPPRRNTGALEYSLQVELALNKIYVSAACHK